MPASNGLKTLSTSQLECSDLLQGEEEHSSQNIGKVFLAGTKEPLTINESPFHLL